jgi:hypothetical protein
MIYLFIDSDGQVATIKLMFEKNDLLRSLHLVAGFLVNEGYKGSIS